MEIKTIDPYKDIILGFENELVLEKIISIMRGIIDEDNLPKVKVIKVDENKFKLIQPGSLNQNGNDGGHHRVSIYYKLGRKFEVEIINNDKVISQSPLFKIVVANLIPRSDPKSFKFFKSVDSKYKKLPTVEELFNKYILIVNTLRFGYNINLTTQIYQKILDSQEK